ncbi:hypothetical protein [Flagellimonas olearia]|uniref:Uncharacterized protein n=1 Tax=Flagellimonas olearia TaxID=552546 RepID=A0A444VQB0_9FLAO|nr:hypothetical protein [Allomuricauda olearia]RYC52993.1 hypothetical protein DN53_01860 [Allomuricauda olearia]|tara:strand:+ start:130 stop:792 length:663 start_codon:yes stop_codon:yes gene_type:complete
MSTTIDIIPVDSIDISFGQVIETAEKHINDFLFSIGITQKIILKVNLYDNDERYVTNILPSDKFEWEDNTYAWFNIEGVIGGTDAYCEHLKDNEIEIENPWWKLEGLELNNMAIDNIKEKLEKAKLLDRIWSFRRSAGQPGIIAVSYGLISLSVAELTNGLLWSDDGAWDYQRFPSESKAFLDWYFRPDKAIHKNYADWAKRCIDEIKKELQSPTNPKMY